MPTCYILQEALTTIELNVFYSDMLIISIFLYCLVCSYLCGLQLIHILPSGAYTNIIINGSDSSPPTPETTVYLKYLYVYNENNTIPT